MRYASPATAGVGGVRYGPRGHFCDDGFGEGPVAVRQLPVRTLCAADEISTAGSLLGIGLALAALAQSASPDDATRLRPLRSHCCSR